VFARTRTTYLMFENCAGLKTVLAGAVKELRLAPILFALLALLMGVCIATWTWSRRLGDLSFIAVCFSPDTRYVFVAINTGSFAASHSSTTPVIRQSVKCLDSATGAEIRTVSESTFPGPWQTGRLMGAIAISQGENKLVLGGPGGYLRILDPLGSAPPLNSARAGAESRITHLHVSPTGNLFAAMATLSPATLWSLEDASLQRSSGTYSSAFAFSPDGQFAAIGTTDGVEVRAMIHFEHIHTIQTDSPISIAFGVDNRSLVVCSPGRLRKWDFISNEVVSDIDGPSSQQVKLSHDGMYAVEYESVPTVWDFSSRQKRVLGTASDCNSVAISADGQLIALGHKSSAVSLWDAVTAKQLWSRNVDSR